MQTLNLIQGSAQWLEVRAKHFTASEAPAMLGVSKYTSRNELLCQKATGLTEQIDPFKQILFDSGHAAEAAARPIVESLIGEELYPVTGTLEVDGLPLLASFDGLTMLEHIAWENKLFNADLAEAVARGELAPHYWAQLEHQLLVSNAGFVYFTTADESAERVVGMWYESIPERRAQLIAGWKQFAEDLANYQYVEPAMAPQGRAPETLPALHIEVTGTVTASNLAAFKSTALAVFAGIKTELKTDEDFANAEKTGKWCGEVEDRLEAAKQHALSQTTSIDELFRTIDAIKAEARAKRLELDKLVKTRKETIRVEIQHRGKDAIAAHIARLNERLGKNYLIGSTADFAAVMKGKKSVTSLNDAVDTELARAKIELNATADRIQINLNTLRDAGNEHLFPDAAQLVHKQNDDLLALIKSRIADELNRLEAARQSELARQEEQAAKVEPIAKAATLVVPVYDESSKFVTNQKPPRIFERIAQAAKQTPEGVLRQFVDAYERADHTAMGDAYRKAVELLKGGA